MNPMCVYVFKRGGHVFESMEKHRIYQFSYFIPSYFLFEIRSSILFFKSIKINQQLILMAPSMIGLVNQNLLPSMV